MTSHPTTDYRIIAHTLELLRAGILASDLADRLRDEFGLTPERAKELTDKAKELYKKPGKRGKLGTKPLDKLD